MTSTKPPAVACHPYDTV